MRCHEGGEPAMALYCSLQPYSQGFTPIYHKNQMSPAGHSVHSAHPITHGVPLLRTVSAVTF